MEGFNQFHIEAAEEAAQYEQQDDGRHHHLGDVVPAALFHALADQDAEHQTRYRVAHDELGQTAEDGGPETGLLARLNGCQPEDHRHDGIDQQVGSRYQHLDRSDLQGGRYGGGRAVEEGDHDGTYDAAGDGHLFRVVQGGGEIPVLEQQCRRGPVWNDAVIHILGEGACCHGGGPGVEEEAETKREVGSGIPFTGVEFAQGAEGTHALYGRGVEHPRRAGPHPDANQAANDERLDKYD